MSFSGGRDSLVVLHRAIQEDPDIPVVYVDTTISLPECNEYVEALAEEWSLNLIHETILSVQLKIVLSDQLPTETLKYLAGKPLLRLLSDRLVPIR